ncbi:hypothetical protein JCM8097_005962 [Rhodosporidiobolus ruineniae]
MNTRDAPDDKDSGYARSLPSSPAPELPSSSPRLVQLHSLSPAEILREVEDACSTVQPFDPPLTLVGTPSALDLIRCHPTTLAHYRFYRISPTAMLVVNPSTQHQFAALYTIKYSEGPLSAAVDGLEGIPVPVGIFVRAPERDADPAPLQENSTSTYYPDAVFSRARRPGETGEGPIYFSAIEVLKSETHGESKRKMESLFCNPAILSVIEIRVKHKNTINIDIELAFFGRYLSGEKKGDPNLEDPYTEIRLSTGKDIKVSRSLFLHGVDANETLLFMTGEDTQRVLKKMREAVVHDNNLYALQLKERSAKISEFNSALDSPPGQGPHKHGRDEEPEATSAKKAKEDEKDEEDETEKSQQTEKEEKEKRKEDKREDSEEE